MDGPYMLVKNVNRCVFTGDTIFVGGCGRFFEGKPEQMLYAMDVAQGMRNDTKVFCGHEYTLANMKFCTTAEGQSNPRIGEFFAKFKATRDAKAFTVPSFLRDEKQYNVFMRCREPALQQAIGESDPVKAMHILREWKNNGQRPNL